MLKRLWLLLSTLWAALILANGSSRLTGIQEIDWTMAAAPFVLGGFCARATRFVITGSPLRSRGPVPYRRP
jgi:hypothetical protein